MCNAAGLNHWELWSKRTCFNSANGESGENVWINLVCFELNPCRINPSYETTHVLSRILPMRIKSPLRNALHVRYLSFLKAECICYFDQWVSRLLWRERKQDAPWCSLFCGTQMAIFERGLGQSSSKMPQKHNCDFICSMEQKYFWRMKIWWHIIRDLKTAVLNRGFKIMTQLYYEQINWLILYDILKLIYTIQDAFFSCFLNDNFSFLSELCLKLFSLLKNK